MSVPTKDGARERPSHKPWRWGTVVTTVFVPLSTLALVLLGYGYTLAVQSVFGINAGLVADSLAEYLQLSSHVIVHLFGAIAEVFHWGTVERFYADFQWLVWLGLTVWFAVFVLWGLRGWWQRVGAWLQGPAVCVAGSCQQLKPRWLKLFWGALFRPLAWLVRLTMRPMRRVRALPAMLWWSVVSLAGILGLPVITLLITFAALTLVIFVYIWFPYIGLMVGTGALQEWVIKPEVCISIRNRDQHLLPLPPDTPSVTGAQCVSIKKDGKELARGRLVVGTSQAVILFDPVSGSVQRVPVDGATIHATSSLD